MGYSMWFKWTILFENGAWAADGASYNSMKNALLAAMWSATRKGCTVVAIEVNSTKL